jgi:hypothetical protein
VKDKGIRMVLGFIGEKMLSCFLFRPVGLVHLRSPSTPPNQTGKEESTIMWIEKVLVVLGE